MSAADVLKLSQVYLEALRRWEEAKATLITSTAGLEIARRECEDAKTELLAAIRGAIPLAEALELTQQYGRAVRKAQDAEKAFAAAEKAERETGRVEKTTIAQLAGVS